MISNHKQFIEAIQEKKKVSVRFYSTADSGVIDLVCAPMDYGPGGLLPDGVNRYRLWDYSSNTGSHLLAFLPEQILALSVLGAAFDPAEFGVPPEAWSVPRDWVSPSQPPNNMSNLSGESPSLPKAGGSLGAAHLANAEHLPLKNPNQ